MFAGSNTSSWIDIQSSTGELTINENDIRDFRVEGGNEPHLLFVKGGNDRVGIATDSPGIQTWMLMDPLE